MFAWGLRHVNVYTVAAGGEGRRQGPKRQLTLTRVDVTKVYYKIYDFERYALSYLKKAGLFRGPNIKCICKVMEYL